MPSCYTHYWKNETWNYNRERSNDGTLLIHTAGNQFRRRGVKPGDTVYVVTNLNGEFYICGKLIVDGIYNAKKAAKLLGCKPIDLWEADEHIVAAQATPTNFHLKVPNSLARTLLFEYGKNQLQSLIFDAKGNLDNQTLRGVRKLPSESAVKLDRLLPSLENAFDTDFYVGEKLFPEEVPDHDIYFEGAVQKVSVNKYERDRNARAACIAIYGTTCFVCDFNFGLVYGPSGEGIIHVHHLKPFNEIREEYAVDPARDLRPVCPNCHAMIHSKNPQYSIEQMKEIVQHFSTLSA